MGFARWLQVLLVGFLTGILLSSQGVFATSVIPLLVISALFTIVIFHKLYFLKNVVFLLLIGISCGILRNSLTPHPFSTPAKSTQYLATLRSQTIERFIGFAPEPEGHLTASIVLGGDGILPKNLVQPMIRTGTIHMAAVSGQNLTIILSIAATILPFLLGRWLGFFFGTSAILLFIGLTNFEPSIIRAAILGWLFLLARATHRIVYPVHTTLIVAAFMIAITPNIITQIGFQLSFASYLGLILFERTINDWLNKTFFRFTGFMKDSISATLASQILSLPLIMYHFGRFSVVSVPANVVVNEIVTLTMFFGLFIVGFSLLPMIGPWLSTVLAPFAWTINKIVLWFDSLPFASVNLPALPSSALVLYYGLIGLLLFQKSIQRLKVTSAQYVES